MEVSEIPNSQWRLWEIISFTQMQFWGRPSKGWERLHDLGSSYLVVFSLIVQYSCQCSSYHACIPAKRKEGDAEEHISLPLSIPVGSSKRYFYLHAELHRMANPGCTGSWETAWILGNRPLMEKSGISLRARRCEQLLGTLASLPRTAFLSWWRHQLPCCTVELREERASV